MDKNGEQVNMKLACPFEEDKAYSNGDIVRQPNIDGETDTVFVYNAELQKFRLWGIALTGVPLFSSTILKPYDL